MNLKTSYLGLSLRHPVIASASPLSATVGGIRRLEDAGVAAIVAASVYEEEVRAEDAAFEDFGAIGAESHAEVTSYLPPLPGYRGALAAHVEMIRRAAESVSVPLIASLNGITREGWTGIAADLEEAGAAALELNLFHIPTDEHETSADVERRLVETVREVCTAVTIPVAVKLNSNFTATAHLAVEIANAGANGLVLFGRCYEPDIDLETLSFHPSLRLSTAEEIRLPLMWIALLAGKTSLSLAAGRGVEGPEEVIKYLLAGADVVLTASSLLRHGPSHLDTLVKGLAGWIEAHDAGSVDEIRGRLSAKGFAQAEALLRAQYVRTLLLEYPVLDLEDGIAGAGQAGANVGPVQRSGDRVQSAMHADQECLKRKRDHGEDDEGGGGARIRRASDDRGGADTGARHRRGPDQSDRERSVPYGSARGAGRLAGQALAPLYPRS